MPHIFDIKTDPAFLEGKTEGKLEGKLERIEEGEAKGIRMAIEKLLFKQLLSEFQISEALEVPLELVEDIKKALVKAGRLKL